MILRREKNSEISLAIVVPAYNEGSSIESVILGVKKYGQVIVVNDASSDDTAEIAKNAGAIVVNNEINCGYDNSINNGLQVALSHGFEYAITVDADGQHDPEDIPIFIESFRQGYKLVIGVRPGYQRWAEWVFALITKIIWGLKDPLCGMKGYSLGLIKATSFPYQYDSVGTSVALMLLGHPDAPFDQKRINIRSRNDSSRFGGSLKGNVKILKALFFGMLLKIWNYSSMLRA